MQDVVNFFQMTPGIATSGQPARDQFAAIADAGYRAVVNLAMHDSDNAIVDEGSLVASLGMTYVHLPVPFDRPERSHLVAFIRIMQALEGERTWVHCVVNARVSAFMYQYLRMIKGVPEPQARTPMLDRWQPRMTPAWQALLALEQRDIF
ncbi:MAG: protein tyrosine phosphatase family protein [Gammaproteobacteria bacterium]